MKWIGALLLTVGTTGLGLFYRWAGYQRIRELEQFIWFFHYLESEISYRKAELSGICKRAADRRGGACGQMLAAVSERMDGKEGAVFLTIWRQECEALEGRCHLTKEDLQTAAEFAADGLASRSMQLVQARLCREKLEEHRARLLGDAVQKGRVCVCMGAAIGLIVSIILL